MTMSTHPCACPFLWSVTELPGHPGPMDDLGATAAHLVVVGHCDDDAVTSLALADPEALPVPAPHVRSSAWPSIQMDSHNQTADKGCSVEKGGRLVA